MSNPVLLQTFDLTPNGKLVERAEMGESGYFDNVEYNMNIRVVDGGLVVFWYGENDTEMSLDEYIKLVK